MTQQYAWYAMKSYCLNKKNIVAPGIYANIKVVQDQIILSVRGPNLNDPKYWESRSHELIAFQGVHGAKVDAVFYQQFQKTKSALGDEILETVKANEIYTVASVGHGAGGVFATFALLEFWEQINSINAKIAEFENLIKVQLVLVSFGQPHIGNKVFAQYMNGLQYKGILKVYRFTNTDDMVPRLPARVEGAYHHYVHSVFEVWQGESTCDCQQEDTILYLCKGQTLSDERGIPLIEESQECNNKYGIAHFTPHNGPYLQVPMGSCLKDIPPWEKPIFHIH
ncbi:hypothetical protein G9A89_005661 [Geosiphon pyriformis]|nr:hypothetical protein G9A89_005661 [Geosiphon pyriformis]